VVTPGFEQGENGKKAIQFRNALAALKFKIKNGGLSALEGKAFNLTGVETHPSGKKNYFIRLTNRRVRIKIFKSGPSAGLVSIKLYDPSMRISGVGKIKDATFRFSDFKKALKISRKRPDEAIKYLASCNLKHGLAPVKESTLRRMLTQTPSLKEMKVLSVSGFLTTFVFASIVNHVDHALGLKMPVSAKAILSNMLNDALMVVLEKRGVASIGELFSKGNLLFVVLFEAYGLIYDQACKELGMNNNGLVRGLTQIGGYLGTKAGIRNLKRFASNNEPHSF
jgi:hypothetical protein